MKKIKLSLQDKYELSKTKVSHYVIGKDGNVKRDTMGHPVRMINSYLTADVKKEVKIDESNIRISTKRKHIRRKSADRRIT